MGEFVKTINITLTDKVKDLVTKYKEDYVAVLYLKVPSAVNQDVRNELKACPEQTELIKQELQVKTEFAYYELRELTVGPCERSTRQHEV